LSRYRFPDPFVPTGGERFSNETEDEAVEYSEGEKSRREAREYYLSRKVSGRCVDCGREATDTVRCTVCAEWRNLRARQRNAAK